MYSYPLSFKITPSEESPPLLSVIIPVYNGGHNFARCLATLHQSLSPGIEVIIVDDGSTDPSAEIAESYGFQVLRSARNRGPAHARNLGAKAAKGQILFFVDADVEIRATTLTDVMTTFQEQPTLAALIGSYDDCPAAANFLGQYKNLLHHYTHQTANEVAWTFWGACGAIRRSIFWSVGGFDERYRYASIEDIEFGYRLKKAGYAIQLVKTLQVKHLKRWELGSLLKADIFYRAIPWTELIWRDRTISNDLNLDHKSRISIIAVFLLLGSLMGLGVSDVFWLMVVMTALILLGVNLSIYQFFLQKRGLRFTLRVIPYHWLYFLYGGLSFAIGTIRYFWRQWNLPKFGSILAWSKS
ncbi:MAG: glycosyltransferase [Synechococcales bacterium]|nr:glycosyltransferase [Synechococcales bacterium]